MHMTYRKKKLHHVTIFLLHAFIAKQKLHELQHTLIEPLIEVVTETLAQVLTQALTKTSKSDVDASAKHTVVWTPVHHEFGGASMTSLSYFLSIFSFL